MNRTKLITLLTVILSVVVVCSSCNRKEKEERTAKREARVANVDTSATSERVANREEKVTSDKATRTEEVAPDAATTFDDQALHSMAQSLSGKIAITSFEGVSGGLMDGLVASFGVRNTSSQSPAIAAARANIFMEGKQIAVVTLREKVVLPKKFEGKIDIPFDVEITNMLRAISAVGAVRRGDYSPFTVTYTIDVEVGRHAKTITGDNVMLKDFVGAIK